MSILMLDPVIWIVEGLSLIIEPFHHTILIINDIKKHSPHCTATVYRP